ncbi:MAG: hypothetical protein Q8K43_09590 [Sulfurimicrobium sp.]|nr:hypothetical protein [Sulfurimicrobium sp.]MDO9189678.1 hypothetical protein [Sulfurimicrobium sp.]MDP1898124.1 hypothetical protein [Sulfurimicrobium sp.]MDP2198505.1 hypothetical protein [Sulfurimicrobium sp.]MDP3686343.1 hypothetical protein [Sulfurimicrobium sp.]
MLVALIVSLCILGFVIIRALTQRGQMRLPGILSALALVTVFAKITWDIHLNPSSHNLLPFELIIWSLICLIGYGVVFVIVAKQK